MADALTLNIEGLKELQNRLSNMSKAIAERVDNVLDANAFDIATKAQQLAPKDLGGLKVVANITKPLEKHITVNAFYAAYVEFGTGKYAAAYVATLPETWRQYAAQFRGPTGTRGNTLEKIQEWTRRKGIASAKDYKRVGYLIYRSILKNGVRPHPFLFPAYEQQRPQIIKEIELALKAV